MTDQDPSMERRLIVAVVLSLAVYLLFAWLNPPPAPPPPVVPETTDAGPAEPRPGGAPVSADAEPYEAPAVVAAAEQEHLTVATDRIEVRFTNRGGRAESWTLLEFHTPTGEPLQLFPRFEDARVLPLGLDLDDDGLEAEVNDALYRIERGPAGEGAERVAFSWSDGRGVEVLKAFTFRPGTYLVDAEVEVTDRGRRLPARLAVGPGFAAQEPTSGHSNYYYRGQAVWNVAGSVTRTKQGKLDENGGLSGPVRWGGLEDQYFAGLVVPLAERSELRWTTIDLLPIPVSGEPVTEEDEPELEEKPVVAVAVPPDGARLFFGPKKFTLLRELGHDLQAVVWFSSMDWLRPVVKYLFLGLEWLHDNVTGNWGLAIILATVLLRVVLFPVNQYSMVSMKKTQLQMQRLQPKIKAIRNKYKKVKDVATRNKMNAEMMELYRKEGVNPMGGLTGCLPLLAQFPILIGFYNMLTVAVELRGAPLGGWIRDLSQQDPFYVLPILMGATMFAQQKMAMTKIKDPQQLQQQRIMLFMPIMFGFIGFQMPSGLVLYWFVNNVLGIGQQWLVNRNTERLEAAAQKA